MEKDDVNEQDLWPFFGETTQNLNLIRFPLFSLAKKHSGCFILQVQQGVLFLLLPLTFDVSLKWGGS
jgi:hypothetical protein